MLAVRLPVEQVQRIKSRAALRGQSLQEAVAAAMEAWMQATAAPSSSLDAFLDRWQGSLAGAAALTARKADKRHEFTHDQRLLQLARKRKRRR
jgi:hypothetical protein